MQSKRELLVSKALELFAAGGYNAVGIDRIIAEAGIAKMTMYKHFPSKNDLIIAALNERDREFMQSLEGYVGQFGPLPEKIHALFVWHDAWFKREDFYGCMFINAAAEFHNGGNGVQKLSTQHKQQLIAYIGTLLETVYPDDKTKKLATQLAILLDGAIVAAHVAGNRQAAMDAWEMAQCLLGIEAD